MVAENDVRDELKRPWERIHLTNEIPEGASMSPANLDDAPSGFFFESWRSIRNPKELLRLVYQYDMLSGGGTVELLNGNDDEVWTHLGWGKRGYRAATVRITAEQFEILEGRPFWLAPAGGTDPLSDDDDVEPGIRISRGYIGLVLQGVRDGTASKTESMESEGGAACRA